MAIPAKLELYVMRSIIDRVRQSGALPALRLYGGSYTAAQIEDAWLSVAVLDYARQRSEQSVYRGVVLFQIGCFAKLGEHHTSARTDAHVEHAAAVRVLFDGVALDIKAFGDGDASTGQVLLIDEGTMRVAPDEAGDGGAPAHGVAMAVVTYRGVLVAK